MSYWVDDAQNIHIGNGDFDAIVSFLDFHPFASDTIGFDYKVVARTRRATKYQIKKQLKKDVRRIFAMAAAHAKTVLEDHANRNA